MVGLTPAPPGVVGTSSGADQRTEPPLVAVELRTEYISSAIEDNPKSARHGIPAVLIKMLDYGGGSERDGSEEEEKEKSYEPPSSHREQLGGYAGN